MFRIRCPGCEKALKVPATARGRKVECSGCGNEFKISARSGKKAPTKAAPRSPSLVKPAPVKSGKTSRPAPKLAASRTSTPPPKPRPKAKPPVHDSDFFNMDAVDVLDVEVLEDVEILDDVEVLDEPQRPKGNRKRKPARDVVEDFEIIDDFEEAEAYDDDCLDPLPRTGPAHRRGRKGKQSGTPRRQRREQETAAGEDDGDGSLIGGIAFMVLGAGIVVLALTTDSRKTIKGLVVGGMMFLGGAATVVKRLTS